MNRIKHIVFALILILHYVWLEVVEAFRVITQPPGTSVAADSPQLLSHDEFILPELVVSSVVSDDLSLRSPLPWLRAATTEWPVSLPPLPLWLGGDEELAF
jgi:hypothetical protein